MVPIRQYSHALCSHLHRSQGRKLLMLGACHHHIPSASHNHAIGCHSGTVLSSPRKPRARAVHPCRPYQYQCIPCTHPRPRGAEGWSACAFVGVGLADVSKPCSPGDVTFQAWSRARQNQGELKSLQHTIGELDALTLLDGSRPQHKHLEDSLEIV